ncbi:SGNH/GDSL hydrolase family protein [Jejuia pallidilutea]|uniref:Lysophospholipase L1 and related esterases n=1 Tax=Jejuia pallidilutea TaxID=504487 RepID=A0A098LPF6_9FLAO|nr:SGNH/GDSL hydrolase family protein [Jejuia pallidilutea]GAL88287.1 lysophospholipase L1 and related esterases [Jejuia pallidilutea]
MKLKYALLFFSLGYFLFVGCSSNAEIYVDEGTQKEIIDDTEFSNDTVQNTVQKNLKILALGDSYTIGESVCNSCRFPEQLKDSIIEKVKDWNVSLKVIARTGWTTGALISAINNETLSEDYDLVTLLIGVNNQYQGAPFEIFEKEFPELVIKANKLAQAKKSNVIIISIPDYAFTPFGNGNPSITEDINTYNSYIENYCNAYNITYVYITDITRKGLDNPNLVASDGLHPSEFAYTQFVSRILPHALEKIGYTSQ